MNPLLSCDPFSVNGEAMLHEGPLASSTEDRQLTARAGEANIAKSCPADSVVTACPRSMIGDTTIGRSRVEAAYTDVLIGCAASMLSMAKENLNRGYRRYGCVAYDTIRRRLTRWIKDWGFLGRLSFLKGPKGSDRPGPAKLRSLKRATTDSRNGVTLCEFFSIKAGGVSSDATHTWEGCGEKPMPSGKPKDMLTPRTVEYVNRQIGDLKYDRSRSN